jgi:hypothetical protein
MSDLPDLADLRVLGASTTEVWAGATEPTARGIIAWAGRRFGDDREKAVRGSLAACKLVISDYPAINARKWYLDSLVAGMETWLAAPTRENQEATMKLLDVTRAQHAWQAPEDNAANWILEAVDHAAIAVWSNSGLSIYITPSPPKTSAARGVACVLRALEIGGKSEDDAAKAIVAAVAAVTA